MQRDLVTDAALHGTADKFRHKNGIFEGADLQADLVVMDAIDEAGDFRNHA